MNSDMCLLQTINRYKFERLKKAELLKSKAKQHEKNLLFHQQASNEKQKLSIKSRWTFLSRNVIVL